MTTTAMGTLLNKRFNEQKNSCDSSYTSFLSSAKQQREIDCPRFRFAIVLTAINKAHDFRTMHDLKLLPLKTFKKNLKLILVEKY